MMKMKNVGVIVLAMAMVAGHSFGSTIIAQETWDGGDEAGWVSGSAPDSAAGGVGTLSNVGETLQINFGGDVQPQRDYIHTQTGSLITDFNRNTVQGIWFDFYVDPDNGSVPSSLQLYFVGDDNGVWFWDMTDSLTSGWNRYGANFQNASNVSDFGFGAWEQYAEWGGTTSWGAFTGINAIGIELNYLAMDTPQIYAIDNFTLDADPFLVPEPETYAFIAMALLSMAFVFRKRLDEQFQSAMARVQTMRMG